MSDNNFRQTQSGLHVPSSTKSRPTSKTLSTKNLAANIQSASFFKTVIFGAVLVYLAYTTYLFGEANLTSFAMSLAAKFTVNDAAQFRMAQFLAGLMAVLVTDGLARAWPKIKAGSAETNIQRITADIGGIASIFVSFYFSAAVLVEQFPAQFSPELISSLSFIGAVLFVVISILNGICIVVFLTTDIETISQNVATKISSLKVSEKLHAHETMRTQGLLQASKDLKADLPTFTAMMKDVMSYELRQDILADIADEEIKSRLAVKYLTDLPSVEDITPPSGPPVDIDSLFDDGTEAIRNAGAPTQQPVMNGVNGHSRNGSNLGKSTG